MAYPQRRQTILGPEFFARSGAVFDFHIPIIVGFLRFVTGALHRYVQMNWVPHPSYVKGAVLTRVYPSLSDFPATFTK